MLSIVSPGSGKYVVHFNIGIIPNVFKVIISNGKPVDIPPSYLVAFIKFILSISYSRTNLSIILFSCNFIIGKFGPLFPNISFAL